MRKFENCVLLTRVGSFYELYFEQAERYGPLLNLKVAQKSTNAGPVPMAGFPFFQLDRFLKVLVQDLEQHVAISEEVANDASEKVRSGGLMFDRRVSRVITPGTLIDERFIKTAEHNYLLAISVTDAAECGPPSHPTQGTSPDAESHPGAVGLAWLDLSTGDFFTQATTMASLPSAISRIAPREIIYDRHGQQFQDHLCDSLLHDYRHLMMHHPPSNLEPRIDDWAEELESPMASDEARAFTREEITAGTRLLEYVKVQLQGLPMKLQRPIRQHANESMLIDKNSLRSLEIKTTLKDGLTRGSLLHTMQKTVTSSGARLLSDRLTAPSTSLSIINGRLDLVSFFLQRVVLRQDVIDTLRHSQDAQRLVQKFSLGRGDHDDLLSLCKAITATQMTVELLADETSGEPGSSRPDVDPNRDALVALLRRVDLNAPKKLAARINKAIDVEGLSRRQHLQENEAAGVMSQAQAVDGGERSSTTHFRFPRRSTAHLDADAYTAKSPNWSDEDVWVMRKGASPTLTRLHHRLDQMYREKLDLAEMLRQQYGAKSLTLRWTPGLGHICHVKGKDTTSPVSSTEKFRSVSASKSTRSFHLPEWTSLGGQMDQIRVQIRAEEQLVFRRLRDEVILNLSLLRRNAAVLDELDIACAFATAATTHGLVRPLVHARPGCKIVGGRHPMVERGLEEQGRHFSANDCFLGENERIWLITGPNMAGKSTFLRQIALITIMAQAGSFVPAEFAEIGLVDQVFSRVSLEGSRDRIGTADNLYQDQSTFMVEMLESAAILRQATSRSLVIMDEVGRGTTSEDGVAVGYACLEHLYHVNRCRTLFATHFHALADLTASMDHLACYCTDVVEDGDGSFSYIHRLRPGVNRQSHALKVARLAGMPDRAIQVAKQVLAEQAI
ncbi:MAG: DNA mismatch repair ATPase msh1 [Thelocarpon superellum]|nr:MAG: DNA mismatch repair ATPase msh1 [Thelocarpon superellum]